MVAHPAGMGFEFIAVAALLLSHCGFFFVFVCRVSFLVGSSIFLLMVVQQLVVILLFLWEEVSPRPSTPPSCLRLPRLDFSQDLLYTLKAHGKVFLWNKLWWLYPSWRRENCGMSTCFICSQASTFHRFCTVHPTAPRRFCWLLLVCQTCTLAALGSPEVHPRNAKAPSLNFILYQRNMFRIVIEFLLILN